MVRASPGDVWKLILAALGAGGIGFGSGAFHKGPDETEIVKSLKEIEETMRHVNDSLYTWDRDLRSIDDSNRDLKRDCRAVVDDYLDFKKRVHR